MIISLLCRKPARVRPGRARRGPFLTRRRAGAALAAGAVVLRSAGRAQEAPGPAGAFIRQVGKELADVIRDAKTDEERRRRLEPFLARVADIPAVARFSLGRFWRQASSAEQDAYVQLFLKVLTQEVASRVGVYGSGDSEVVVLPEAAKPDGVYVPTLVRTGTQAPVRVTWVVDTSAQPFRILDVQAEGISLRLFERNDFTSFLNRNGGDIGLFLRTLQERAQG